MWALLLLRFDQKKYLCSKHNNSFIKYCEDCCLNIWYLCNNEHAYHKTISIIDINKDIEKSKNKLKDFRIILDTLNEQINEITSKLYKLIDDLNIYYEINNNILNNYDDKKINYQAFKDINEININNEIYEKIKNINETTNLKNKIISILDLYTNINKDNYEINKNIDTKKEKEK